MTALPVMQETEALLENPAEALSDPRPDPRLEARPRRVQVESSQSPYRRPPVVRHHRRRRALGTLRLLAQAAGIVGLPTAAVVWALTAPQFAVQQIYVTSTARVPASWVEAGLEPVRGQNLLRLSLAEARQRLVGHPWLKSVSLSKRLPDVLEVAIVEREPVAVLESDDAGAFVDADGGVIAPVEKASDTAGLPRLRGSAPSRRALATAIATAEEFERLGAPWGGHLERIEILGPEDFRLVTDRLPFPLVVRRGSLEEKHYAASRLLPEIVSRIEHVRAVDLRFAQRIVLQTEPGGGGLIPPSRHPSRG